MTSLAVVRHEWEDGSRRIEASREDAPRYRRLHELVDLLLDELRRRIGQTYSLAELAAVYADADVWAREALDERAPARGWPRDLTTVLAAAFHVYSRGAVDYGP